MGVTVRKDWPECCGKHQYELHFVRYTPGDPERIRVRCWLCEELVGWVETTDEYKRIALRENPKRGDERSNRAQAPSVQADKNR